MSTPTPVLRVGPRLVAAALALSLTPACDRAPRSEPVLRLLDRVETSSSYTVGEPDARAGEVLLEGASVRLWHPLARMDRDASDEELATFLDTSEVLPDGVLRLGGVRGAWVAVTDAVEPGTVLELSAHVRVDGLARGGEGRRAVRMLLAELREAPESVELAELQRVEITRTWGESILGDGVERDTSLVVRTTDRTRSVALFFFLNLLPALETARVEWSDIRLAIGRRVDLLRAASDDPDAARSPGRASAAPYSIAQTRRPAIGVLQGDRAGVRATLPEGQARLEAALGLVPCDFAPRGESARLSISVAAAGDAPVPLVELELEHLPEAAARWHEVDVALPANLSGREVEVVFGVDGDGSGPLVGAFAAPRIATARPTRVGPNVVVVSLDTLRADRVGCYGAERDTTPHIDRLAQRSLVFEEAWSTAPYTLPSHVSLFTGQLPGVHGAEQPGSRVDPVRSRLLSELLYARGWQTAAFTGGGFVHPDFGFARGFERYGTIDPVVNLESAKMLAALERIEERDLALVEENGIASVLEWIDRNAERSFYLFVHTYAPHEFDPPASILSALDIRAPDEEADAGSIRRLYDHTAPSEAERERLLELYDGSVRHADRAVGALVDRLAALGLAEQTIVVVTSDHGKELGEHGAVNHGHSLHRELLHVPLLIRVPGVAPARIATPVSSIDVLPTLLDALDLAPPPGIQGVSLLSSVARRPLFAEVDNVATKLALRRGDLKTIVSLATNHPADWEQGATAESFDLSTDPDELAPLPRDPRHLSDVLETGRALRALRARLGGRDQAPRALDPATRAQLEDLGYTLGEGD